MKCIFVQRNRQFPLNIFKPSSIIVIYDMIEGIIETMIYVTRLKVLLKPFVQRNRQFLLDIFKPSSILVIYDMIEGIIEIMIYVT